MIYGMQSPIPPEFHTLQKLKYLYLSSAFDSLPKSFYQLKKLHHLSLSMDSVKFLENGISNLQHLKYLRLDCSIKKLPNDFSDLDSLNELTLDIKKEADWKSIFTEISMCKKLRTLDLSYHYLNYLPNEISLLHNIDTLKVKLDVRNKDIKNINIAINKLQELKNLKVLELDNLPRRGQNYYLPKELQNLNQLKELYLHDELKKAPKWIESMSSLQTIRFNDINDRIELLKSLPQHINLYEDDEFIKPKTSKKVPYISPLKKDFMLLDDVNIGDTLCINYQSGFVFFRHSHSFKLLLIRDTTGFLLAEELINCINLKKTGLKSYKLTNNQLKQLNSFLALPNKENPKEKKCKKREIRRLPQYISQITLYYKNKSKVISNEKLDKLTKFRFHVRKNNFSIE